MWMAAGFVGFHPLLGSEELEKDQAVSRALIEESAGAIMAATGLRMHCTSIRLRHHPVP